jgi:two-component system response regulator AtoC
MKGTILLIEDDKLMRVTLEDALKSAGYEVVTFETGTEAIDALNTNPFDVVITDVRLPDIDGLNILRQITGMNDTQVIVMTAFGTIKDAVEAMRLGAFDYITKPFALDEFLLLIERALDIKRLRDENVRLKRDLNRCYCFPNIIGESEEMRKVFSLIEKVSDSDSTVLLLGESGTGKELIATTIHYQSKRKDKPLIKVNCAAIPEGLIESELFGHEKGAFTGAIKRKPGRILPLFLLHNRNAPF